MLLIMMEMPAQLLMRVWPYIYVRLIEGGVFSGVFSHARFCSSGIYPIHEAADRGHSSTLELLIANNADVNSRDEYVMLMVMTVAV